MDGIKSWALTACLAALAAGIAGIVAPAGKLEKTYRFAVSLFFLCCLVTPLFSLRHIALAQIPVTQTQSAGTAGFQSDVAVQEERLSQQSLAAIVRESCGTAGVKPFSVSIGMKGSGNSLALSSVTIVLRKEQMGKRQAVEAAVKEKLGIVPEIRQKN